MKAEARPRSAPSLLGWEINLLGYVLGLLAFIYPLPSTVCLVLVYGVTVLFRQQPPRVWALACCFAVGFGWAMMNMPDPPQDLPDFVVDGEKVEMKARVASVRSKTGQRLQIVLEEVRATADGGSADLPGRMALNWDYPPVHPLEGQTLKAELRIKPVRNLINPVGWDYELYWRTRGVFLRGISGATEDSRAWRGLLLPYGPHSNQG